MLPKKKKKSCFKPINNIQDAFSIHGCQRLENQSNLKYVTYLTKKPPLTPVCVSYILHSMMDECILIRACVYRQTCVGYIAQLKIRLTNRRDDINIQQNISHSNTEAFSCHNPILMVSDSAVVLVFFFFLLSDISYCATNVVAADSSILLVSSSSSEICYSDSVVMR